MPRAVAATASAPLPPLVPGLPLLGSVGEIARRGMLPFLEQKWHELGDTFRIRVGSRTMMAVVHPDGVEHVLAGRRENYVKGRTYDEMRLLTGAGLLTLEGRAWLGRRRLEQPAFHRESIKGLVQAMAKVTRDRLGRWRARGPQGGTFDAHREMMGLTLEVVGETLFGEPFGEASTDASASAFTEALRLISDRANGVSLPLALPTPRNLRLKRALKTLDQMVFRIISAARARPGARAGATLLEMLLSARDTDTGEGLTDVELRDEVITLFLAGHETTALLLTWGFTLLGRHPDVVARARAEVEEVLGARDPTADDLPRLSYLKRAIDEILRLRGPTWTVARDAVEEDVLCGFRVRPGDVVMPISYLTHRHPAFWEEPERFDPDRFLPERVKARRMWAYYPFSMGPRMCIGNVFSLVEAQIVLAMLLQQLDLELVPGPEVLPSAVITLRPSAPVRVSYRWR